MKIRLVLIVFCVVACLSVSLKTAVSAACQDLKEQMHGCNMRIDEMEDEKAGLLNQLHQTQDPTERHDIDEHIGFIEHNQTELIEGRKALEHKLKECEKENGNGHNPLIIAAIIGASGAVLAALIGLLKRR